MRLGCIVIVSLLIGACSRTRDTSYPEFIRGDANAELKARLGCVDVFDLRDEKGTYKALVLMLPMVGGRDSDYRVLFYKYEQGLYRRHGAENNLVNFERPRLSGEDPPKIETAERASGAKFKYRVTDDGVELEPSEGTWSRIR